jgi:hypothetical protein
MRDFIIRCGLFQLSGVDLQEIRSATLCLFDWVVDALNVELMLSGIFVDFFRHKLL